MRSFSGCGLTSRPRRSWWQPGRASICRAAAGGAVGAAGALTGGRGGRAGGGVAVAAVPGAGQGAGHTRAFDDTTAWLAAHASKQAVRELLRTAWATVGRIGARVAADAEGAWDRFEGLRRIGIDEISYKKGHRYLMVVVDHDSRRLVWAAPGRDQATLRGFFDLLGPERCDKIRLVSADA